ncbi:MmcQ/YjbR family DNA-binding protein [Arthrobacter sp. JSM 101049]|uniref:MmcQ/YjbR family DNA-binding protein n=1 Tax=Arthrobacter sp. JSM 101049 TaxID=929097 RepID=UPI003565C03D
MDHESFRAACLQLAGAFEDHPFGPDATVFKVSGRPGGATKMFALLWDDSDPARANLKCEPVLAEQLRAAHPEITPGYHMSKKHWNTVLCSGSLDGATVRDLIEDSYDLVVESLPRTDRERLGWKGLARG